MISNQPQTLRQAIVVGHQQSAFAAVNVLVIVEAEPTNICQGSGSYAIDKSTRSLGGVCHELETVAIGNGSERRHISTLAKDIDSSDGTGSRCNCCLNSLRIKIERLWINICKHRDGIPVKNRRRRRHHRPRRDDHFITRL